MLLITTLTATRLCCCEENYSTAKTDPNPCLCTPTPCTVGEVKWPIKGLWILRRFPWEIFHIVDRSLPKFFTSLLFYYFFHFTVIYTLEHIVSVWWICNIMVTYCTCGRSNGVSLPILGYRTLQPPSWVSLSLGL